MNFTLPVGTLVTLTRELCNLSRFLMGVCLIEVSEKVVEFIFGEDTIPVRLRSDSPKW